MFEFGLARGASHGVVGSPIKILPLSSVSILTLGIALAAGPARAGCEISGIDMTCSGSIGTIFFAPEDTTVDETVSLTIEDATQSVVSGHTGDTAAWNLSVTETGIGQSPAALDAEIDAGNVVTVTSPNAQGLKVAGFGSRGLWPSEDKGNGDREGDNGGAGGKGSKITANIGSLSVTADEAEAIYIYSQAGTGGQGGEGYSNNYGDGDGGVGGHGGAGGTIDATLTDLTLNGAVAARISGNGGDGGLAGHASACDYTAHGGAGGTGGTGGSVSANLSNVTSSGGTGIVVTSAGGDGGDGGLGANRCVGSGRGGDGGTGGAGNLAELSNTVNGVAGDLSIHATQGSAIIVESIAGDGGDGGEGNVILYFANGVGGNGARGGDGGQATVDISRPDDTVTVNLTTSGDSAPGILARSYGGAGGNGGSSSGIAGHGGAGAGSGNGAGVQVTAAGTITTGGDGSDGIMAQSVGGFAGDGGTSDSIVSYGASSESAGVGGTVSVTYNGGSGSAITTTGDNSDGIFAQSQGGGGGKASSSAGLVALSGDASGSSGGDGGAVTVVLAGPIETEGERSRGLVAQSVGGTGGDGGGARGLVSIGGTGAAGGSGGNVSVTNSATIVTKGDDAIGILAQSVGGGGGSAGSTAGISAIGGNGGDGATGGDVDVTLGAALATAGTGADGVVAQSIGGSGGYGANALAVGVGFSMAIAGTGGTGNDAGTVTMSTAHGANVSTTGDNARGIALTSIGGGGGHGGNALSVSASTTPDVSIAIGGGGGGSGDGAAVRLDALGAVGTQGDNGIGILALSVGGGGGSAGTTISGQLGTSGLGMTIGKDGGNGGDGGTVTVCRGGAATDATCNQADSAGSLTTSGDAAAALVAISVGGSGGHSGATGAANLAYSASVAIGGSGGAGGVGGDVTVYSSGGIATKGHASAGISALSVGGSGGAAHFVGSVGVLGSSGFNLGLGGDGGDAGGSGVVTVTSAESITTEGDVSAGIEAISQAGSGGSGSTVVAAEGVSTGSVDVSIGGDGGNGGVAGAVTVTWTGNTLITGGELSPGVVALSSGGSGGNGGMAISGLGVGFAATGASVGGGGGTGGVGGDVSVTASGAIKTAGFMSDGIAAISMGGSGGRGGLAITGNAVSQGAGSVTLGGGGGTAGQAGAASAETLAGTSIETAGLNAAGITVLSLGGSGGHGGLAVEGGFTANFNNDYPAGNLTFTMGGDGGDGGTSGAASAVNRAIIVTDDLNSPGILVQSIGGDGGSGGGAISANIIVGAEKEINISVALGGEGGGGGKAGAATVTNAQTITTQGDNSDGIQAQSIGGSGGSGGVSYSVLGNLMSGGTVNTNANIAVGGNGGDGGTAGTVTVTNSAALRTTGTSSTGIYAQSVGGNGGQGGFGGVGVYKIGQPNTGTDMRQQNYEFDVAVGGNGGAGATGGQVSVTNDVGGTIATTGAGAYGIFAQSVGGNGGDGGLASNYGITLVGWCGITHDGNSRNCQNAKAGEKAKREISFKITIGGNGGGGAHSGAVSVTNDAGISTTGDVAHGIFAQSVGGGGGTGGSTSSSASSFYTRSSESGIEKWYLERPRSIARVRKITEKSAEIRIGGAGGSAGNGETVTVTNSGAISTTGINSYGIFGQSVGGGGGSGGESNDATALHTLSVGGFGAGGGDAGVVTITNTGAVSTVEYGSAAIFGQSVGGGGGNTGSKQNLWSFYIADFTIGGANGVAGDGASVHVTTHTGAIVTGAEQSPGIIAQSVGGGGGTQFGSVGNLEDGGQETIAVGGTGKAEGSGGYVTVTSSSDISTGPGDAETLNSASFGIFAQSVGGGGGYAGSMIMGDETRIGSGVLTTSVDAKGAGGTVTVKASGRITTTGSNSVGIFAQSVGGGGGVQGNLDNSSTDGAYIGSFGGQGPAGAVSVTYSGPQLTTTGAGAHGIFAQFAGGTYSGAAVSETTLSVDVTGNISATGAGATAIHVENAGQGVAAVSVQIGAGATIRGGAAATYTGAEPGAGVFIQSDQNGTLTNAGSISAVSGMAVRYTSNDNATLTFTNSGTVTGSVQGTTETDTSGTAASASDTGASILLDNLDGGVLNAGRQLAVQRLRNWGTIYVGQADAVGRTNITGNLLQRGGTLEFDVDMLELKGDLLRVGGQAELDGKIRVNVVGTERTPDGFQTIRLIEAEEGLDLTGLDVVPSVVARYRLQSAAENTLDLGYEVDYANTELLDGLTESQGALSTYYNRLFEAGELDTSLAESLIAAETQADYATLMNGLGPELALDTQIARVGGTLRFADGLFSCPHQGQGLIWSEDGQCGYLTLTGNRFSRDATGGASGFYQNGYRFAAGGQILLNDGLALGGALAYDNTSLGTDTGASSDGDIYSVGLSLKQFVGAWTFGAAVHVGSGSYDNQRVVEDAIASGTQDQWVYGAELRAAYTVDQGKWFLRPGLGLGVARFGDSSYTETGAAGVAMDIQAEAETLAYLRPSLEIGGSFLTAGGAELRPTATLAMTQFLGDRTFDATARLASAPASVAPFGWSSEMDATRFDLVAGLTVVTKSGATFDIGAFGMTSSNDRDYGGTVRWTIPF